MQAKALKTSEHNHCFEDLFAMLITRIELDLRSLTENQLEQDKFVTSILLGKYEWPDPRPPIPHKSQVTIRLLLPDAVDN